MGDLLDSTVAVVFALQVFYQRFVILYAMDIIRRVTDTVEVAAETDVVVTYVYRMGLGKLEFSTGTAVGLFNSVISMILVLSSNFIARKATGKGIW